MHYRSCSYATLRPWQVRARRFRMVGWFGRRGFDPDEVRAYLDRVATDLASLYDELNRSRDETIRLTRTLSQVKARQSRMPNVSERW